MKGERAHYARTFGRQYEIRWDSFIARYRVTLGDETIGFHQADEGAKALAVAHAHRVSVGPVQPFFVSFHVEDQAKSAK